MTYRPRVYIGVDPMAQARGLRDHLQGELRRYSSSSYSSSETLSPSSSDSVVGVDSTAGASNAKRKKKTVKKIAMVNLIDKHSDQGRLGRAFDSVLNAVLDIYSDGYGSTSPPTLGYSILLRPNSIEHIWFDFHAECKGGRYDRLSQLLELVVPTLNDQGYFSAVLSATTRKKKDINASSSAKDENATHHRPSWVIRSLQDGVVRTNCMDCLDRTNVVQSMFGRYIIFKHIHERMARFSNRRRTLPLECVVAYKRRPMTLPWADGEESHRYLWADNADAISRLYAGTPALKGDFTRTGRRTRRGALDDGVNSLQRYYLNNFIDADRQEGMDLLVGDAEFDSEAITPSSSSLEALTNDELSRLFTLKELSHRIRKRRGYDETHARIKVESGESFGGDVIRRSSDGKETPKMRLKWFMGDVRHYMSNLSLWSRSLLGKTTRDNAPTSAEFLLQVTSTAAGGDGIRPLLEDDALDPLRSSFDHDDETGHDEGAGNYAIAETRCNSRVQGWNVFGSASKRTVVISLILLVIAPILSAAIIAATIACGFYASLDDEDRNSDQS
ncbi:hypothetical protein ACHAW5_002274 [Stephanodiscus triporus]|uniref:SAC domain-containing protein n=1 Tax=Stephanodiscus triporus TaxID=2934178 RepID=A0ABD3N4N7_9STRA